MVRETSLSVYHVPIHKLPHPGFAREGVPKIMHMRINGGHGPAHANSIAHTQNLRPRPDNPALALYHVSSICRLFAGVLPSLDLSIDPRN